MLIVRCFSLKLEFLLPPGFSALRLLTDIRLIILNHDSSLLSSPSLPLLFILCSFSSFAHFYPLLIFILSILSFLSFLSSFYESIVFSKSIPIYPFNLIYTYLYVYRRKMSAKDSARAKRLIILTAWRRSSGWMPSRTEPSVIWKRAFARKKR